MFVKLRHTHARAWRADTKRQCGSQVRLALVRRFKGTGYNGPLSVDAIFYQPASPQPGAAALEPFNPLIPRQP